MLCAKFGWKLCFAPILVGPLQVRVKKILETHSQTCGQKTDNMRSEENHYYADSLSEKPNGSIFQTSSYNCIYIYEVFLSSLEKKHAIYTVTKRVRSVAIVMCLGPKLRTTTLLAHGLSSFWIRTVRYKICRPLSLLIVSYIQRFTHLKTSPLPVKGYTRHSWPLSSECSYTCHTYTVTQANSLIMVSSQDQWHSHIEVI